MSIKTKMLINTKDGLVINSPLLKLTHTMLHGVNQTILTQKMFKFKTHQVSTYDSVPFCKTDADCKLTVFKKHDNYNS